MAKWEVTHNCREDDGKAIRGRKQLQILSDVISKIYEDLKMGAATFQKLGYPSFLPAPTNVQQQRSRSSRGQGRGGRVSPPQPTRESRETS